MNEKILFEIIILLKFFKKMGFNGLLVHLKIHQ